MAKVNQKSLFTPRLASLFKEYSADHRTRGNQLTHTLGIPLIVVGLLGLLSNWVLGPEALTGSIYFRADGGSLLLVLGVVWYFYIDWKIAIPFSMVVTGLYFLGRALPFSINLALFVGGWILQAIGHAIYEKRSPAFFKSLIQLMVGPLWIFVKVLGIK